MVFDLNDLNHVRELVKGAAVAELMSRFESVTADLKADGSVITAADLAMQQRLQSELASRWPEFSLLGEEMDAEEQEHQLATPGHGLWCLDPLDGTANFAAGIPFFAVSLALIRDSIVRASVVYDPVRDECFSALRGRGAWLNGQPLMAPQQPTTLREAMAMVDLKRLPAGLVETLARGAPYRSQRSFGSVALDWCWLACGRCQVYLHGGQKLWDYAGGRLVLAESGGAGGLLDAYDGSWQEDLSLKPRIALAATHADLLEQWRSWIVEGLTA